MLEYVEINPEMAEKEILDSRIKKCLCTEELMINLKALNTVTLRSKKLHDH